MNTRQFAILLATAAAFSFLGGLATMFFGDSKAVAQPAASDMLATREIRLVDDTGRTRALLSMLRGNPRLIMTDEKGEFRAELGMNPAGWPLIALRDGDGRTRISLTINSSGAPSATLADKHGRRRAVLALAEEGTPSLIMSDDAGRDRVALWQEKGEQGLALADSGGHPRAGLSLKNGAPSLAFYGPDRKIVWYAPRK